MVQKKHERYCLEVEKVPSSIEDSTLKRHHVQNTKTFIVLSPLLEASVGRDENLVIHDCVYHLTRVEEVQSVQLGF